MRPKLHIVRDVAGAHDVYPFSMKLILSLLAMMALTSAAMASQEQIHNWKAATLVADTYDGSKMIANPIYAGIGPYPAVATCRSAPLPVISLLTPCRRGSVRRR